MGDHQTNGQAALSTATKSVENTVFVRFLPPSDAIRRHHVEDVFSEIGPIKKSSIIHTRSKTDENHVTSSYGFVKYTVPEDAALAAIKLNNIPLRVTGTKINVTVKVELATKGNNNKNTASSSLSTRTTAATGSVARGESQQYQQNDGDNEVIVSDEPLSKKKTNRLIVRNLSFYAKEKDIREAMSQFGELEEVHIPKVLQTGGHRGFCFVTFAEEKAAKKCLKASSGSSGTENGIVIKDRAVQVARSLHKTAFEAQKPPTKKKAKADGIPKSENKMDVETDHANDDASHDEPSEIDAKNNDQDDDDTSEHQSDDDDKSRNESDDEEREESVTEKKRKPENQTSEADTTAVAEKRCLFLRNLPFDSTRHDVFEAFRQFGYITSIFLVKDKETHTIPKGTAFVSFREPEQAAKALNYAAVQVKDFVSQRNVSVEEKWEVNNSQGGIILKGRRLLVDLAVDKETATTLTVTEKKEGEAQGKDRRNLYLIGEGRVENDEKNGVLSWDELPEADKMKRQSAWSEKNTKLRSPLFFINPHRLSLRNLAKHVDEAALKQLCVDATIRGLERHLVTAEDQIAHWRAGGEMTTREILARIQESTRKETTVSKAAKTGPASLIPSLDMKNIKQFIPSVHIHRDIAAGTNKKLAPSRGFGFVEFEHHVHALACLRELNNNTRYSADFAAGGKQAAEMKRRRMGKKPKKPRSQSFDGGSIEESASAALVDANGRVRIPRLIVEFTVENKAKAKQQADHRDQQKANLLKQLEENQAKNQQSADAKGKKTKKETKSRGKAQREKKRKERESGESATSDLPTAETVHENASSHNRVTPDSARKLAAAKTAAKPAKPPKKRKVDDEDSKFTKLVESYKQQAISAMGNAAPGADPPLKTKIETRWFDT